MAGNSIMKKSVRLSKVLVIGLLLIAGALLLVTPTRASQQADESVRTGIVHVKMGDKVTPVAINGGAKVSKVLERMGVTLTDRDDVRPSEDTTVYDGDTIYLTQRQLVTQVEKGVIPFETIYYYSGDTTPGKETVVVAGKNGHGTRTYRRLLENGEKVEEELIDEQLTTAPVTQEVAIGFKSKPVSAMDFEWEFDENGQPLNTVKVLRNQRSTAYTAGAGARTASGRVAQVGHVAVNPNVIPYGSKLFIQSSDDCGNLIYGYAVAADTGTALMDGRAHVDLYFDSMNECIQHGVKTVDIFVLETP